MDWYSVDRRLAPLFQSAAHQVGSGFWIAAKEPIELAELLDSALDDEERDEYEGSFEHWPAHVGQVIERSDAQSLNVLDAFWSTAPGLSSTIGLDLVGVDARAYLCAWDDFGGGHRAVALLQPGFDV